MHGTYVFVHAHFSQKSTLHVLKSTKTIYVYFFYILAWMLVAKMGDPD